MVGALRQAERDLLSSPNSTERANPGKLPGCAGEHQLRVGRENRAQGGCDRDSRAGTALRGGGAGGSTGGVSRKHPRTVIPLSGATSTPQPWLGLLSLGARHVHSSKCDLRRGFELSWVPLMDTYC